MKHRGLRFMVLVLLVSVPAAVAQNGHEFLDPAGQYKLTLVGDWHPVSYNDAVGRQKTEFVYRDRSEGLLKISRESLTGALGDMVHREEENLKIYRSRFDSSSSEQRGGRPPTAGRGSLFSTDVKHQMAKTCDYRADM